MKRMWAIVIHAVRDGCRLKVWYPFLAALVISALLLLGGFGIHLKPNVYANNIISSFFLFWMWGTVLTAFCLGAASIPIERRSQTLFTLPIARWEIFAGKLIGTQLLIGFFQIAGYLISVALAVHNNLPVSSYSLFALVTAFVTSFQCLSLTIPLGARMSPIAAGTVTASFIILCSTLIVVVDAVYNGGSFARSAALNDPLRYAFFDRPTPGYSGLGLGLVFGVIVFSVLTVLSRRHELSMK